ncbi:MAG: hypothetical protein IT373_28735 [Polyangiaceae bacterium]|nr:hypothetical protein [Polyangiaceae bacterium]
MLGSLRSAKFAPLALAVAITASPVRAAAEEDPSDARRDTFIAVMVAAFGVCAAGALLLWQRQRAARARERAWHEALAGRRTPTAGRAPVHDVASATTEDATRGADEEPTVAVVTASGRRLALGRLAPVERMPLSFLAESRSRGRGAPDAARKARSAEGAWVAPLDEPRAGAARARGGSAAPDEPAGAPAPGSAPELGPPPGGGSKICPSCGRRYGDDDAVCGRDGERLSALN